MKRQGTWEQMVADRIAQDLMTSFQPHQLLFGMPATTSTLPSPSSSPLALPLAEALPIPTPTEAKDDTVMTWERQHRVYQQRELTSRNSGRVTYCRGHDLTPTCVALQQTTGEKAISGSKDHSVMLWDVETGQKIMQLCPKYHQEIQQQQQQQQQQSNAQPSLSASNTKYSKSSSVSSSRNSGQVLCVACSDDGRFAAVGKRDATVSIYDVRISSSTKSSSLLSSTSAKALTTFTGHKGPVTCLAFRSQSHQLFTGSDDRCIRYVVGQRKTSKH
jgi:WD40 repeat protein